MKFLEGLNDAQLKVATHRGSPLLVFAAAGTGKTQALTARIAHLVAHDGVPPHKILALTFTRKAAAEMRQRAAAMCEVDESKLRNVGTFHSLCVRILRKYGFYVRKNKNRLSPMFTILEPEQVDIMLDELLMDSLEVALRHHGHRHTQRGNHHHHQKALEEATKASAVRKRIDVWRNRGLEPDDAQVIAESEETLLGRVAIEAYTAYRDVCAKRNVVDFGDLLLHACRTLEWVPGAIEDCRTAEYAHLLVDEFQDTNEAQMRLVRILTGASSSNDFDFVPKRLSVNELMVVGDDYQAIHEWRGATVRNILDFTRQFPTSETVSLSLNYRSVPSVLEAARNVIVNNANQRHKELIATREEEDLEGSSVDVTEFESPQDEADKIAAQICAACQLNPDVSPSHFAILYRSNAHSQPLEQALRTRGIPYRLRGGARSFFERAEIKDTMAYARLLLNPRSDLDFERAIHVPHRGVGEVTIEHLRERIDESAVCMCLMEAARAEANSAGCPKTRREALTAFTSLFADTDASRDNLPGSSLRELLNTAGYLSMIKEAYPTNGNSGPKDRYENVIAFLNLAEQDPTRPLQDFIDACSTLDSSVSSSMEEDTDDEGVYENGSNCVSLMTMHASKGLEFKIVYVAGFAEGSLPHSLSVVEGKIDEERRLCYVAITRARDRLILCIPKTRMRFGQKEETKASRFLTETRGLTLQTALCR